ncbi:hypothetical protein SLEP1_g29711 [Rubroshorea leprosula]|uniref:PHD-type domain-containing protein n=1 Tax=Rubroshorea leprosula TaxID=152421 RepID=A0AAV5K922_9ROSI|nr:hypothetical protein SLEP1_g29711 [Rubroshorea leprosula]
MIQVDTHIQQLDQYLKRFDEELRCERENAAAAAVLPATSLNGSTKSGRSSEGGSGGRHPRHPYIWFLYRLLKLVFVSCYCAVDSCFRVPEEVIFSITCASCEITPETWLATATAAAVAATEVAAAAANPTGMELDLPVDPNEPTYCFCNQVSFGEMVACDNPDACNRCKIEWFHFGCVGLKEQPKGKWYCSDCAAAKNRRKSR